MEVEAEEKTDVSKAGQKTICMVRRRESEGTKYMCVILHAWVYPAPPDTYTETINVSNSTSNLHVGIFLFRHISLHFPDHFHPHPSVLTRLSLKCNIFIATEQGVRLPF